MTAEYCNIHVYFTKETAVKKEKVAHTQLLSVGFWS